MFKSILVPTDGSPLAETAFGPAIEAARMAGGKIVGIAVARPYTRTRPTAGSPIPDYGALHAQEMLDLAREHAGRLADACMRAGVACETHTPCSADPGSEILAAVRRFGCDVIFMASHGRRGIGRVLLGSETQRVLAASPVPVMIFRQAEPEPGHG